MVLSGLDTMMVSLDGATRETYVQYRHGGHFERVLANVAAFHAAKLRLRRTRPALVWKFIVFDHNRHEVDIVRRTFRERGFDAFELVANHGDDDAAQRTTRAATLAGHEPGYWPWNKMVIRWDGTTQPCCEDTSIRVGNAAERGARAIGRGDGYAALRAGFSRRRYGAHMHPDCARCLAGGPIPSNLPPTPPLVSRPPHHRPHPGRPPTSDRRPRGDAPGAPTRHATRPRRRPPPIEAHRAAQPGNRRVRWARVATRGRGGRGAPTPPRPQRVTPGRAQSPCPSPPHRQPTPSR